MSWLAALVALTVVDVDERVTPPVRAVIETRLVVWRETSGHSLSLVIADAREPDVLLGPDDARLRLGPETGTMDLVAGDGLLAALTPGVVGRLDDVVVHPRLVGRDVDGAALFAVDAIITTVDVTERRRPMATAYSRIPSWAWGAVLVAITILAALGVAYPELALLLALGGWFGVYSRARRAGSAASPRNACVPRRATSPRPGRAR